MRVSTYKKFDRCGIILIVQGAMWVKSQIKWLFLLNIFFLFTISNKTFVVKEKQGLADKFPMCNVLVTLVKKKKRKIYSKNNLHLGCLRPGFWESRIITNEATYNSVICIHHFQTVAGWNTPCYTLTKVTIWCHSPIDTNTWWLYRKILSQNKKLNKQKHTKQETKQTHKNKIQNKNKTNKNIQNQETKQTKT